MRFLIILIFGLLGQVICFAQSIKPTEQDLRYSKEFERSLLDLWVADAKKPTPLVVYFHGGGFKKGDKKFFQINPMVRKYYPKGISFASVNYPFLGQVEGRHLKILTIVLRRFSF